MRAPGSKSVPAWAWPVVLVTAIHLLTTSGGWWVTDHGEVLTVANRFISTGRLDLDSLDPEWADWARITQARGNTSTRFQPLSILALTPFLALDRVLGWGDRSSLTFVHLQGHAFVTLGLVLVAHAVARRTGSAAVVALSVLLAGLNWPVWMIARRLGPEPVLFALLAAFAAGGRRARFWSLFLLPWVHASGPILGLGALLGLGVVERSLSKDAVRSAGIGWTAGIASVAFFWNLPVHGHILLGGYGEYSQDPFFTLRNPLVGLLTVLGPMILWTLPLWGIAAQAGRRGLEETLALWLPATAFLSVFSNPEPERRLAPLLGAWTVALLTRATPG
ncbi:MAG: hypothetical protein K1Y01_13930, partial [Vicinamibacteria bacterium]|nr:hypothetical protein [Vicinamibacteria bacterium]